MSLLFDHSVAAGASEAAFTLKSNPDRAVSETVLVGKALWDSLSTSSSARHHRYLSIQPIRYRAPHKKSVLRAIVCSAILDEGINGLAIPVDWLDTFSHIFSKSDLGSAPSLLVSPTEPILLSEVIVTALSNHAYHVACSNSFLETWLSSEETILRHGAIHTLASEHLLLNGASPATPTGPLQYRLELVEPVLQGFARKGDTKFIIILSETPEDTTVVSTDGIEDVVDGIEIGEAFLASSALAPIFSHEESSTAFDESVSQATYKASPTPSFQFRPLLHPVNELDDRFTLYIRTVDLSRVGMLNGDWGLAWPIGSSSSRLVRVVANDDLIDTSGFVAGSPILLHNICGLPFQLLQKSTRILVQSSPFGSRQPAVPVARALTVARVASPTAVNRLYQLLFLKSLKTHLGSAKSLIKKGDIIAVSVDTNSLDYFEEAEREGIAPTEVAEYRHPVYGPSANEVVFFCITNVEHDVMKTEASPDLYVSSTTGELGCWADPSVTRIIQAGLEHCWIPDVGSYLESASPRHLYSTLISLPSTHLLGPGSSYDKLLQIASAALAPHGINYNLSLSVLLKGARGMGKFTTAFWVAQRLGMHVLETDCYDLLGESDVKTEGMLRARFDKARNSSPCLFVLRHLEAFSQTTQASEPNKEPPLAKVLQDCIEDMRKCWKIIGFPVITIGTTSQSDHVPLGILSSFKHGISFEAPVEDERLEILASLLSTDVLAPDVSLLGLATHTAALVASDLVDLVARAKFASIERATTGASPGLATHLVQACIPLTAADFEVALGKARSLYSEIIGAPKIPNVSWDDVGGLAHIKTEILDTIQLPLDHPELFADGLKKRSGILLYGPPGTGKTLLAKAVATSCSLNFFSVKGPELLNMYIGESEANVRRVFQRARDAKPCVVFFDELDSIAPKRGNQGDSGGVMDRIVSQLLAELDGMSSGAGSTDVFVIGATNRPDLLDPALLRPGRFDRMLYLGVSETHDAQTNILEALTRKFRLDPDVSLREVAEHCPFNYTGADFYALCSDAMLFAMSRKAELIEHKIALLNEAPRSNHSYPITPQYYLSEIATSQDVEVLVSREDFDKALDALIPSVSQAEMDHYSHVQKQFSKH